VIEQYKPKSMHTTPTMEHDDLTNYLITSNKSMYTSIINFINTNGKTIKPSEFTQIHSFLSNIGKWEADSMDETSFFAIVQYIKNAILMFSKIYPAIILNKSDIFKHVPKHWNLSQFHNGDIKNIMNKYYDNIEQYKGDIVLTRLLDELVIQLTDLNIFVQNIPVQADVVKHRGKDNEARYFALFDKSTSYLLLTHCLYCVLQQYILFSENTDLLHDDIQSFKLDRRAENANNQNPADNLYAIRTNHDIQFDETEQDIQEIQIELGNKDKLKVRVCSLIVSYLKIEYKNKSSIDYTYEGIIDKVNRAKSREKTAIFDEFNDIKEKDERAIMFILKEFRIGRWNVGSQPGLVSYDQKTYDRERLELIRQSNADVALGVHTDVTDMRRSIYDIDREEEAQQLQDEEVETGINGLSERFTDGVVDDDGDDDDDF
jgi:hypothetical protein